LAADVRIVAAPIAGDFAQVYAPWPWRFYIVDGGDSIMHKAMPAPGRLSYDFDIVPEVLDGLLEERKVDH
jgi:hypothetical protein